MYQHNYTPRSDTPHDSVWNLILITLSGFRRLSGIRRKKGITNRAGRTSSWSHLTITWDFLCQLRPSEFPAGLRSFSRQSLQGDTSGCCPDYYSHLINKKRSGMKERISRSDLSWLDWLTAVFCHIFLSDCILFMSASIVGHCFWEIRVTKLLACCLAMQLKRY